MVEGTRTVALNGMLAVLGVILSAQYSGGLKMTGVVVMLENSGAIIQSLGAR